jgi:hypothetical protein
VIEEKETWIHAPDASGKGRRATHPVPAVSLRYWKENTSNGPGTGKTLTYRYSEMDTPFDRHWEILYD